MKKHLDITLLALILSSFYFYALGESSPVITLGHDSLQHKIISKVDNRALGINTSNDTIKQSEIITPTQSDMQINDTIGKIDLSSERHLNNMPNEITQQHNQTDVNYQNEITPEMNYSLKELHSAFDRIQTEIDIIQSNLDFHTILAAKDRSREEIEVEIKRDVSNEIAALKTMLEEKQEAFNLIREESYNQKMLLDSLNSKIISLNNELASSKTECDKSYPVKIEEGKKLVFDKIMDYYQTKTLDYLIKNSTLGSLNQDLLLIGNNAVVNKNIQDLQIYYSVKNILEEKYNEQNVNRGQVDINDINNANSEALKSVANSIRNYKTYCEGLKQTLSKIIELDDLTANSNDTKNLKMRQVIDEVSDYFHNYEYRHNIYNFPYLTKIIIELMDIKRQDVNGDIKHLIDKL